MRICRIASVAPGTWRYHSYLCNGVVPWVDARYRTLADRAHCAGLIYPVMLHRIDVDVKDTHTRLDLHPAHIPAHELTAQGTQAAAEASQRKPTLARSTDRLAAVRLSAAGMWPDGAGEYLELFVNVAAAVAVAELRRVAFTRSSPG
jgi:hypothetical protein